MQGTGEGGMPSAYSVTHLRPSRRCAIDGVSLIMLVASTIYHPRSKLGNVASSPRLSNCRTAPAAEEAVAGPRLKADGCLSFSLSVSFWQIHTINETGGRQKQVPNDDHRRPSVQFDVALPSSGAPGTQYRIHSHWPALHAA